jgi:hypothetical protein
MPSALDCIVGQTFTNCVIEVSYRPNDPLGAWAGVGGLHRRGLYIVDPVLARGRDRH